MEYSVREAKTHLSKLLADMQAGHDVIITKGRDRMPIAQLVPYRPKGGIKLGLYAATMGSLSDEAVLAPLYTPEELEAIDNDPDLS
jgi:antitoxin (DNA-binding transcriptional repressor) of toxin-antitoxin stability system